jgi:hypothetical protein
VRNKNTFWGALNYYSEAILTVNANAIRGQKTIISNHSHIWNGDARCKWILKYRTWCSYVTSAVCIWTLRKLSTRLEALVHCKWFQDKTRSSRTGCQVISTQVLTLRAKALPLGGVSVCEGSGYLWSVHTDRITWHYSPEDCNINFHCCKNPPLSYSF